MLLVPAESIRCAAIECCGEIFESATHFEAFDLVLAKYCGKPGVSFREGFVTSVGRFVEREEALLIAEVNDQIPQPFRENSKRLGALLSEHLM